MTLETLKNSKEYINLINEFIKIKKQPTLDEIKKFCHFVSPELKNFCEENKHSIDKLKINDKGLFGKYVEFYIFGNKPNNDFKPDTLNGDIKTTNLKKLKDGTYNVKERLTLTNFGNPYSKDVINEIITKNSVENTKFFNKISKGTLFVSLYETSEINQPVDILNKKIICLVPYNLKNLDYEDSLQIQKDFILIKNCLSEGNPTQAGQKYLHIPRHSNGGKNMTRAFAFTNRFLTKIISKSMGFNYLEKNNTFSFEIH